MNRMHIHTASAFGRPDGWDVISTLERYGVEYIATGSNVANGHINIKCPFCTDDPSHHMGINLNTGYWGCWRDGDHRGKHPYRLLHMLLGLSKAEISSIVDNPTPLYEGAANDAATRLIQEESITIPDVGTHILEMKRSFVSAPGMTESTGSARRMPFPGLYRFWEDRLMHDERSSRGMEAALDHAISRFDLRIDTRMTGPWAHRLIFPVYLGNTLVTWTGRTLGNGQPRYRTLPMPRRRDHHPTHSGVHTDQYAKLPTTDTLLGFDGMNREGGEVLFLTEGPMDALNVDCHAYHYGVRATCLFGKVVSNTQITLLTTLAKRFEKLYVMLDSDAFGDSIKMVAQLAHLDVRMWTLPDGVGDPGDLTVTQVEELAHDATA